MENKKIHPVIEKYRKWKEAHPNEDYQYDEIHEFLTDLTRGEILDLMEWALGKKDS